MTFKIVGDTMRQKPEIRTLPPICRKCGKPHPEGKCEKTQEVKDVPSDRQL